MKEYESALLYHNKGKPGKFAIKVTKSLNTEKELSLAYSPGVAAPCLEIQKNVNNIYKYTSKGNLVAVITNGTAVLGLGNLGASAAKPVMEGKAVLFKKFADIDAFDIEVNTEDPYEFINSVKYLGASWGGVNLEDIKAPECFLIEQTLKELMDIPVFHDDQHGTAIVVLAGLINALFLTDRKISDVKIVINGAGAAGIACFDLILAMGGVHENITLCDSLGVIYKGRNTGMNKWKEVRANDTSYRTLQEAMRDSHVFIGLSKGNILTTEMVLSMSDNPIIFAIANPEPEILPEKVKEIRNDAIIATGRSDYDNQINNVMCFPYIFRGAIDVRSKQINTYMKIEAAKALAKLARAPVPQIVQKAYSNNKNSKKKLFGRNYIIPSPFDPRLITIISHAVAKAAIESGVAQITNFDLEKYKITLSSRLNPTFHYMVNFFNQVKKSKLQRIVFAEGEEEEVIKAAMVIRDEKYAIPILVGREERIYKILSHISHNVSLEGIQIINASVCHKIDFYIGYIYSKLQRKGYLYRDCARLVTRDRNAFASCMVACSDADAMVTGITKNYYNNLEDIKKIIDIKEDHLLIGYSVLLLKEHRIIFADTSEHEVPDSETLKNITIQSANLSKSMGYSPRVALLSFSNFGNPYSKNTEKVRECLKALDKLDLDFEYDGDMRLDVALNRNLQKLYPFCRLTAPANVLIMPGLNSASIANDLIEELTEGTFIGPLLHGFKQSVQVVPTGSGVNDIIHFAIFAAFEASLHKE